MTDDDLCALRIALGARLRQLRDARDLTVADVARHLGCERTTIYHVEQGAQFMSTTRLLRLLDLYRADLVIQERGGEE